MAEQTEALQFYPWPRGMYTTADAMQIPKESAECILNGIPAGTRDQPGGTKTRPGLIRQVGTSTTQIGVGTATENIIHAIDYWSNVSNTKQARFVAVTESNNVFADDYGGSWSLHLNDTSVSSLTLDNFGEGEVTSEVMNEDLLLGFKDSTDSLAIWEGQDTATLLVTLTATTAFSGTAGGSLVGGIKRCWILRQHQNRMFYAGDPQNPDRLYVSKAGAYNALTSGGTNTSESIDVFPGDGDPEGITAIFPSLNSQELYLAKRRKLYKIITSEVDPADWPVIKVSDEIGCVNHNTAKTIDQRDVYFESDLGVHSLFQVITLTTSIEGTLVSFPISKDFRKTILQSAKSAHNALYLPDQNLYLLTTKGGVGSDDFDTVYAYSVETGEWSKWQTSASATFNFLAKRFNKTTGKFQLYAASDAGYINELDFDTETDLDNNSITLQITSALLFPQLTFLRESNFTDAYALVRVSEDTTLSLTYKIDNAASQTESQNISVSGGNTLGTTVLGSTTFFLGVGRGVRPIPFRLSGVGYGASLTLGHDDLGKSIEIYGIIVKYSQSEETRDTVGFTG